jgi:hypothetical protein
VSGYKKRGKARGEVLPDTVGDEHANVASPSNDPRTYHEAMARPDSGEWAVACAEELDTLCHMEVYETVEKPPNHCIVGCKWVFTTTCSANVEVVRHKAHLMAKGYMQLEGIDYDKTFAPVVKFASLQTLLEIAACEDLEICQLDIKSTYLHGDLKEEIYMQCPHGHASNPDKVWKLKKSLYRLKQAGHKWYRKLCSMFPPLASNPWRLTTPSSRKTILIAASTLQCT